MIYLSLFFQDFSDTIDYLRIGQPFFLHDEGSEIVSQNLFRIDNILRILSDFFVKVFCLFDGNNDCFAVFLYRNEMLVQRYKSSFHIIEEIASFIWAVGIGYHGVVLSGTVYGKRRIAVVTADVRV